MFENRLVFCQERFFILTTDYLHCFKRGAAKNTEMGEFIFKVSGEFIFKVSGEFIFQMSGEFILDVSHSFEV
jgi:hypothetical protein